MSCICFKAGAARKEDFLAALLGICGTHPFEDLSVSYSGRSERSGPAITYETIKHV